MSTVTATLTLSSTDVTSDDLSFSVSKALSVTRPTEVISRIEVPVSTGSIQIKATNPVRQYVYIHHTGFQEDGTTTTTNTILVELTGNDTVGDSRTIDIVNIAAGEWAFFPVAASTVLKLGSSSTQKIQAEYAFFTAS